MKFMKHINSFSSFNEGKTFRANKKGYSKEHLGEDKINLIKDKVKEHIKSIEGVKISNIGNDFVIRIDGNKVAEIMFRDRYIGLRKEGQKFVDELGYNELGKIKFKINDIINSHKKDQE
jgi:hypothetical protein